MQCPRCNQSTFVNSAYTDEERICVACGHIAYAKPKPLPPLPPADTDYQRSAGRKGAVARWFNPTPLTDADIARMREWREQGKSIESIALEVGKSLSTVHAHLNESATDTRRAAAARRLGKPALTDGQRDEMRQLYADGGITQAQLAARYGVSKTFVHFELQGIPPAFKAKPHSRRKRAPLPDDVVAAILADHADGVSQRALARKYELSAWRIHLVVRGLERYERTDSAVMRPA